MCETKKILFIYNIIVTDKRPNQGQARIFHKDRREKSVSAVDTRKRRLRGTRRKTLAGILAVC